jgi:hypothetical protein
MRQKAKRMLDRFGDTVVIIHAGSRVETRALIRPLLEQERMQQATPFGMSRKEQVFYFGLPDTAIAAGDLVEVRDVCYEVLSARGIYLGSRLLHWWGLLSYCGRKTAK